MRRIAAALATLCLLAAQSIFVGTVSGADPSRFTARPLTPDTTFVGAKSDSGAIAKSDPALLGRTDAKIVNVLIKYDFDATASYTGGVAGLAATSPGVTGKALKLNGAAVKAYDAHVAAVTKVISARAKRAAPQLKINFEYLTAYGGVSGQVPANQIANLLKVDGVVAVQQDKLEQPQDDNTTFIGARAVWPALGGSVTAGSNVIVGVIDTGIWPEHPMVAPLTLGAPAGGLRGCEFGDGTDTAHLGPAFACNNKLIGAYAKTATYMAIVGADANEFCNDTTHVCSPRDPEGHGTHTTTTAAGDCVASAILYGVQRGPVCGIAPGARVIQYRVCLESGCFGSDSVDAVQQAILDGVNVINFSISGGAQPYSDPVELAFLDAVHAGISVNASAGNSGPGAGTADHGGPWVTTVGASTGPRFFTSTLHLTADGGAAFNMAGTTLTNGITSPTPVVLAQNLSGYEARCLTPLAPGIATGMVVMCQRGGNARVDKGFNVLQGGAVGMILYNPVKQDQETDNHWLPAIHLDGPPIALLAFVNGHTNVRATWAQGAPTATRPDVMAAFSSRGPTGDWIKPDVTAPGIQVLAGMTPQPTGSTNGPPGNLYQAIAGTSMSSPHAAGVSALVKAAHFSWTPEQIKSALMTSSVQTVVKEDGVTPATPFDMGAGSIRANRAVNPTLVFNETTANFVAAGTNPLHRIDINIPSIDATTMTGQITTSRIAANVSGRDQRLRVTVQQPAGSRIIVSATDPATGSAPPATFLSVRKNHAMRFWVTIIGPDLPSGQYFGRITLRPSIGTPVTIPVAFVKQQGIVTLTHVCSPLSIRRLIGRSDCTATVSNFASVSAHVNLDIQKVKNLELNHVVAPAGARRDASGIHWSGTLTPAIPPRVTSITPTTGPDGGYLDLSLLGVAPVAGVGDDSITNFNVPTFYYGGEAYTRIGVVSNGYVVVGGGDSGDVVYTPQSFPDPNRPNNVLAPLWTDLDPTAPGGSIKVAALDAGPGGPTWVVIDWNNVKNFGNATTHTFEMWLQVASGTPGTGPSSEQITFSYAPNTTFPADGPGLGNAAFGDAAAGVNWGAENRVGNSGVNFAAAPADGTEWSINTAPPAAGGSQTITYVASSRKVGRYRSTASMTSDVTPGITQVAQTITVGP